MVVKMCCWSIAKTPECSWQLVQAYETLADPKTRKREVTALTEAMAEQNHKMGTIVTRHEEESITTENGTIEVVPAWRFLLGM